MADYPMSAMVMYAVLPAITMVVLDWVESKRMRTARARRVRHEQLDGGHGRSDAAHGQLDADSARKAA